MTTKTRAEICKQLDEAFASTLALEFEERFKKRLNVEYNIFAGRMISTRADDMPLSDTQSRYIAGFETAWLKAREIAHG